jgi:hypothetical protein
MSSDSAGKLISCSLFGVENRAHVFMYFGNEERFHDDLTAGAETAIF